MQNFASFMFLMVCNLKKIIKARNVICSLYMDALFVPLLFIFFISI